MSACRSKVVKQLADQFRRSLAFASALIRFRRPRTIQSLGLSRPHPATRPARFRQVAAQNAILLAPLADLNAAMVRAIPRCVLPRPARSRKCAASRMLLGVWPAGGEKRFFHVTVPKTPERPAPVVDDSETNSLLDRRFRAAVRHERGACVTPDNAGPHAIQGLRRHRRLVVPTVRSIFSRLGFCRSQSRSCINGTSAGPSCVGIRPARHGAAKAGPYISSILHSHCEW